MGAAVPEPALVDTHCHLDAAQFAGEPTAALLARAAAAGVTRVVTIGTDVVEELVKLALATAEREPDALFIAGQVVFQRENLSTRMLHNEVAFALQRRLIFRGLDMLILPVRVPEEIW